MARVRIYGPKELLDETTCILYEWGIHLEPLSASVSSRVEIRDRRTEDRDAVRERIELEALHEKVRKSLILLPRPRDGEGRTPPVDIGALRSAETARIIDDLFRRVETLAGSRKAAADRLTLLAKYQGMVRAILPLVERVGDPARLEMVGLTISRENQGVVALLEDELRKATGGLVQVFSAEVDEHTQAALVLYGRSEAAKVRALLWDRNLSELKLPAEIAQLPLKSALEAIADQSAQLPAALKSLDRDLALLAEERYGYLSALHEALSNRLQQIGTRSTIFKTRYSFVVPGWVPRDSLASLRRELEEVSVGRIVLEEVPVPREEEMRVPIQIVNPALIRPFEVFVRLLPLPRYRTVDPTPLVAITFPLFFGFIVGDLGYGLTIAALALILRRRFVVGSRMRDLATVLLYSAGAAALFGIVFGEFFGTLGAAFGLRPLHPNLHRLKSIPFFLGLSVAIGCLHVFLGIVLGMVNSVRRRHRAGLWHRAGQAMALVALILIVAVLGGGASRTLLMPAVILLLGGMALWIAGEGFTAPIELLSMAGNVLSYARLMAVGLAGVVLAMVANELGSRSLWGVVAALALHLINLVLCVFSPTIHAMRLHLVEFFTKFYETGGLAYKPLKGRGGV